MSNITLPYSMNAIDGHSSSYLKGTFDFTTTVELTKVQPTYLWFQHADQSADIYVDNVKVTTHWGGYNAFFVDITNYVHVGTNNIKIVLCNTTRLSLAPCAGDFNFNATLGEVKVFSSPVLPDMSYGYDGFHVDADVTDSAATIVVKTKIPEGADVICKINDGTYHFSEKKKSLGTGENDELSFSATVTNPHLWNGTKDPHLYNIVLEVYHNGDLYHKYERPYGLRYYDYVINETISGETYTGFLLNGSPYFLRGVCMHNDIDAKANALSNTDVEHDFELIQDLGCNFIRLAHYPHPKEVYDWCDRLGIIVQTEVPWVNNANSTQPADYYDHLAIQYDDMVKQHFNHPCIIFWGLSNETTTDDKAFAKTKIEGYTAQIKALDPKRLVGYVVSHSVSNPSSHFNNPNVDWFGCNIYVGWYISKESNDPTTQLNTRVNNIITNLHKPLAFSEYGCGGTQHCHSPYFKSTTNTGNFPRHDIEYQMWLHEGHIAAIRNFPQLLFTGQWQLFDIAVSNRNEGFTECIDGENTTTNDNLRRLNNKGLVERDHTTKKDTYYIYKAEWNPTPFVHICQKDYTKNRDRVIKCYTNEASLSLYVNNVLVETKSASNHIVEFTARDYHFNDVIRVDGATTTDTFTFTTIADYSIEYFTLVAKENTTFRFSTNTMQYSIDNGSTWVSLPADTDTPTVTTGNKIMFKQTGLTPSQTTGIGTISSSGRFDAYGNVMSLLFGDNFKDAVSLSGKDYAFSWLFFNCAKIIDASNIVLPATTLSYLCYSAMFTSCSNMTKAPKVLPNATGGEMAYSYMFRYCSSITETPVMKNLSSESGEYYYMFAGCTALKKVTCYATEGISTANFDHWLDGVAASGTFTKDTHAMWGSGVSAIPSGWTIKNVTADYSKEYFTLETFTASKFKFTHNSLYYSLDSGNTWTELPANTETPSVAAGKKIMFKQSGLTPSSSYGIGTFSSTGDYKASGNIMSLLYGDNFSGETSLTAYTYAFNILFYQSSNLVDARNLILPATTLSQGCYKAMFQGCTRLYIAPTLPAQTLATASYSYMFQGCTQLGNIKCLATDVSATNSTTNWLYGVATNGYFVKASSMNDWTVGENGIPANWTVMNE